MHIRNVKKIIVALVFVAVFSTVLPARVFAEDTTRISNSVQMSSHTGGQSSTDGQDGRDGSNGQDGQPGTQGSAVIQGKSTASTHVESTINGKKVIDVHEVSDGDDTTAPAVLAVETDDVVHVDAEYGENPSRSDDTDIKPNGIQHVLSSIRLILLTYVGKLF